MKSSHPSTYQIAKLANVSVATVSRVINGRSGVNEQTRELVWRAIRELQYEIVRDPNVLDGVIVLAPTVSFNNTYLQLLSSGILKEASRLPTPVMFSSARTSNEAIAQIRSFWPRNGILGVIKACFPMSYRSTDWVPNDPNIVSISVLMPENSHYVNIDMYSAVFAATKELIELGHTDIALGINSLAWWGQNQRLQGYSNALKESGVALPPEEMISRQLSITEARKWLEELLQRKKRPTAVIGGTSELSKNLFHAMNALRVKIPQELSFIGFGHLLPYEKPLYNTIAQPTIELGAEAVRILRRAVTRPNGGTFSSVLSAKVIDVGSVKAV